MASFKPALVSDIKLLATSSPQRAPFVLIAKTLNGNVVYPCLHTQKPLSWSSPLGNLKLWNINIQGDGEFGAHLMALLSFQNYLTLDPV